MFLYERLNAKFSQTYIPTEPSFLDKSDNIPRIKRPQYIFIGSCTNLPAELIHEIRDCGYNVNYKTFSKGAFSPIFKEFTRQMGYTRNSNQGITVAKDPLVAFKHVPVYGCKSFLKVFIHSGFEYVWEVYPGVLPSPQQSLFKTTKPLSR